MFSWKLWSWETTFKSEKHWHKPVALNLMCMTVVLLISCCHDNRHKVSLSVCGGGELRDQTRGAGQDFEFFFLEENLCHYSVPTSLWFTAAYSPYSSTSPWSPCRLNVEQHHDWDATFLHSPPPLQQFWLTPQHTLFNPRKRAPRLGLKLTPLC